MPPGCMFWLPIGRWSGRVAVSLIYCRLVGGGERRGPHTSGPFSHWFSLGSFLVCPYQQTRNLHAPTMASFVQSGWCLHPRSFLDSMGENHHPHLFPVHCVVVKYAMMRGEHIWPLCEDMHWKPYMIPLIYGGGSAANPRRNHTAFRPCATDTLLSHRMKNSI